MNIAFFRRSSYLNLIILIFCTFVLTIYQENYVCFAGGRGQENFSGIVTSIIATVEHNSELKFRFWRVTQKSITLGFRSMMCQPLTEAEKQ